MFWRNYFCKNCNTSTLQSKILGLFLAKRNTPVAATSQRKSSGWIIFVIVTKIIIKENVPRNYFVIILARMVVAIVISCFGYRAFSIFFSWEKAPTSYRAISGPSGPKSQKSQKRVKKRVSRALRPQGSKESRESQKRVKNDTFWLVLTLFGLFGPLGSEHSWEPQKGWTRSNLQFHISENGPLPESALEQRKWGVLPGNERGLLGHVHPTTMQYVQVVEITRRNLIMHLIWH